jgi:hypothetical protein
MATMTEMNESKTVLTIEEFWEAFVKSQKEFDRRMQEADRRAQEADRRAEEADRRAQEFDRRMQESHEKAEREMQKLREAQQETARVVKETSISVGGLHNSFGELAEYLVTPNIREKFDALGYHFKNKDVDLNHRVRDKEGRIIAEIDLLLENDDFIMAVEVKSKPKNTDIDNFVRRLEILRNSDDRLQDKRKIRGAIAGAVFTGPVKKAVLKAGFYVIEQAGDTMKIDVPEGFKPRSW